MRLTVHTRRLAFVAVAVLALSTGTAAGASAAPSTAIAHRVTPGMVTAGKAGTPIHADAPASIGTKANAAPACTTSCMRLEQRPATTAAKPGAARPADLPVKWPDWCTELADTGINYTRTDACESRSMVLQTFMIVDGEETQTGELDFDVVSYSFVSTVSSSWVHEVFITSTGGWGDALGAAVTGLATSDFGCTTQDYSFENGAMLPFGNLRSGEADIASPSTAAGAIGFCTTQWTLLFDTPTYVPVSLDLTMIPVRCDNDTAGASGPGCVFPDYPSALIYSWSANPSLATHVYQAQQSGLPGGTYDAPLTRNTDDTLADANYQDACGDARSITGLSCDEYPVKSSQQGLAFETGGDRRTFPGCAFDDLPENETGPLGVSVCMINVADQNAQGGLNTQFYRANRVLDGDPFVILLSS
jgi:hypothetical protein